MEEQKNFNKKEKLPAKEANDQDKLESRSKALVFFILALMFLFLGALTYIIFTNMGKEKKQNDYADNSSPEANINPNNEEQENPEDQRNVAKASSFAAYEEVPVNINPSIPDYKIEKGLNNVANQKRFEFSPKAKELLEKNGFVVIPGKRGYSGNPEFFPIYESNRYAYILNFVTTDSILHNYHLMFDYLLKKLEENKLVAILKELNADMLAESLVQYDKLKGSEWENAAKRNIGFFAVGGKLLDPNLNIPQVVENEVKEELSLINEHSGISVSPVMNMGNNEKDILIETKQGSLPLDKLKEDYSQYISRGHYDKKEELRRYFKSMMWYGRLSFRLKNKDEVKSAALIVTALNKENNHKNWDSLYEPINFFVGKSDDITYYQLRDLLAENYGENVQLESLVNNKEKLDNFIEAAKKLAPPQINSMPIFAPNIQGDREEEIKGFRFMGQRFTIDASIFQRLVYREVGDKEHSCQDAPSEWMLCPKSRCLPKGMDITSAMGSKEAFNILKSEGEDKYACYTENMNKMKNYLAGLDNNVWTQNLYWGWLYSLLPLTEDKTTGYPSFMQNLAWQRKDLNTYLGSWTELKHDTILYAKQVYAELGGGGDIEKFDDRGYVEPNVYVYARLAGLLKMTKEGLKIRGLLTAESEGNLKKMEDLVLSLKGISEKELNNTALTEDEYEIIRSYGGQLEHFWIEVNKEEENYSNREYLYENPSAIISDVATDPNGSVLEEGTGNIFIIYAIVPVNGKLMLTKGGVYSYYEFAWPMSDRLTDKKWREMLKSDNAPKLPSWTNEFMAE